MKKLLLVAFVGLGLVSCKKNSSTSSTTSSSNCSKTISYKNDIAPIMTNYCTDCHTTGFASGGINLSSYSLVSSNASRSYSSMKGGTMPQGGSMPDSLISKFNCWISQGKLNN